MKRLIQLIWQLLFPPRLSREAKAYRDTHSEEEWEAAWGEWSMGKR